jgi:drug/metabolite transporter (DMT)-like permease
VRFRSSADALLVVCVVIWGLNFTVIKEALGNGFEPLAFGSTRFAMATAAFVGVSLARGERLRMQRRDALVIAAWSGAVALNQIGFAYSFHLATASTIALLFGTLPIFAGIYSQLAGIDRLGSRRWLAAAISFFGVAMVAIGVHGTPSGHVGGILISLVAPATFSLYSIGLTPYVHRYGTYTVNLLISVFALPVILAISSPQLASMDWGAVTPLGWLCLAYSALVAYTFTNLLWFVAVKRVGAARASVYANLQPFIGAVFALLILSETMTALEWLGGAAIAAGIVLSRTGSASWKHVALETETAPHE